MGAPSVKKEAEENLLPLIEGIRAGDRNAAAQLIEKTQGRLFGFCFHLCWNRQVAEDLAQETFVRALKQIGTLQDPSRFIGWLFRIAHRLFLSQVRRPSSMEQSIEEDFVPNDADFMSPSADVSFEIRKVLQQLKPDERSILLLIDLEECSYAEAAKIIGISENAVRSRLHRARQAFIKLFNHCETFLPSDASSVQETK